MIPPLTVAIPTMKRWDRFLFKYLPVYLESPQVTKVLICDETGEDIDAIEQSQWANHPKLILHRNKERLGIYHNKRQCIELSPTEWVGVFDSDNFFPQEYFDTLEDLWTREGANQMKFYACGNAIFINDDTNVATKPLERFRGLTLNKENWNTIFSQPFWNFLLNDGNWVVHQSVINVLPRNVLDKDILAADAIYMVHIFVKAGYIFHIDPDLSYYHITHNGSTWTTTAKDSLRIFNETNWFI